MSKVYTFKKITSTSVFLVMFGYAHVTQASHLAYKNVNQNSSKVK